MLDNGYIKLYRSMTKWQWYQDITTTKLFIHCILRASISTSNWQEIVIERGQFVSSYASLSKESGLSEKQVRTSIKKLERAGCVARSKYPKYTVFTVLNYEQYQDRAGKWASKGQGEGKVRAGKGQQYKKTKKIKNTPLPPSERGNEVDVVFLKQSEEFYLAYPKKQGKEQVIKFFQDKQFSDEQFNWVMRILNDDCNSDSWKRENGRFVPKPINWLKDEKYQRQLKPKQKIRVFSDDPYPQQE